MADHTRTPRSRHAPRSAAWTIVVVVWALISAALDAQDKIDSKPATTEAKQSEAKKETKAEAKAAKEDSLHVNGEISLVDPLYPRRTRGGYHYKMHECKLFANKRYLIELIDPVRSGMDPYLILEDDKMRVLEENDDGAGNLNSRILYTPSVTGTYRLYATTLGSGQTGRYELHVRPLAPGESVPPPAAPSGPTTTTAPPTAPPVAVHSAAFSRGELLITTLPLPATHSSNSNDEGHGYVETRFIIENRSETEPHRVTLAMPRWRGVRSGPYLHANRRTVDVAPRARVPLSLWHPDVPAGPDAIVTIDGFQHPEGIPTPLAQRGNRLAFHFGGRDTLAHVLAPQELAWELERNIHKSAVGRPTRTGARTVQSFQYKDASYTYAVLHQLHGSSEPLSNWSRHWLSYSSYDGVALAAAQLASAPAEVQAALWQYVEAGGTLLVVGSTSVLPETWARARGQETSSGLTSYYPGFGQVLVSRNADVAKWEPPQWWPVATLWEENLRPWSQIQTPPEANRALPVVDELGIPVRALFGMMLFFTVLIGPVNLYVLSRLRRRMWLLWTVPAFSLLTCMLIFGVMLVSEGWQGRTRTEGVTYLDENSQRAASISWLGIYSPLTPGDGLHFTYDTEVSPHFKSASYRNHGAPLVLDWSDDQHLVSGWVSARVPAHFLVRTGTRRLERLLLRRDGDRLTAVNGLKAPIAQLSLADLDGALYTAQDPVPAGAEVVLRKTGTLKEEPGKLRSLYLVNWLATVNSCSTDPASVLVPGSYVAVVDGVPFLEEGLRGDQRREGRSVVIGVMKGTGDAR